MIKSCLAWFALGLTTVAAAQEPPPATARRTINPIAIHGNWIGAQGAMPTDCNAPDGFHIGLGTTNGRTFQMTVDRREGGKVTSTKSTLFTVMPPPANTPLRIDVFLTSPNSDMGVVILTGSAMELVPAGADKSYGATSLYLKRCG